MKFILGAILLASCLFANAQNETKVVNIDTNIRLDKRTLISNLSNILLENKLIEQPLALEVVSTGNIFKSNKYKLAYVPTGLDICDDGRYQIITLDLGAQRLDEKNELADLTSHLLSQMNLGLKIIAFSDYTSKRFTLHGERIIRSFVLGLPNTCN